MRNQDLLHALAYIEGTTVEEMLESATADSIAPGICVERGCNYNMNVEPDATDGWCEDCKKPSVKSCLILAGVI